jgi:glutaredoxin-like protein NrdH
VEISREEQAVAHIRSLGYVAAPVVVAGDLHWSGIRPDKVRDLIEQSRARTRGRERQYHERERVGV